MTGNDVPTGSVGNPQITPLTSTFFSTLEKISTSFVPFPDITLSLLGLLKEFSFLNFEFRRRILIFEFSIS